MKQKEIKSVLESIEAKFTRLLEHAQEQYPHFESERGQEDIKDAIEGLSILHDVIFLLSEDNQSGFDYVMESIDLTDNES